MSEMRRRTLVSPERVDVPVAVPYVPPSDAALVTVDLDEIIIGGGRCTRLPSLPELPRQLMLLSSSHVLTVLLAHPCLISLQLCCPTSVLVCRSVKADIQPVDGAARV